jgi:hypothetical protein
MGLRMGNGALFCWCRRCFAPVVGDVLAITAFWICLTFGHLLFEITGVRIVDCALVSEYEPSYRSIGVRWSMLGRGCGCLSLYLTEDLFRR